MGNENTGRKMPRVAGHRRRLSDITNTPVLTKARTQDENLQHSKGSVAQLQKELAVLKKMLEEKEEIIEENKRYMEKLWINYCRKTKQNDEIILHNAQLYKDLMQARDKLKVLQHENAQMSALHKVCKAEMQQKFNEALAQVDRLRALVEVSTLDKALYEKHSHAPSVLTQTADSAVHKTLGPPCEEDSLARIYRPTSRKRESKSYKEPSLKVKMRQLDGGSMCPREPATTQHDDNAAVQGLHKISEDRKVGLDAILTSCKEEAEVMEVVVSPLSSSAAGADENSLSLSAISVDDEAHTMAPQPITGQLEENSDAGEDQSVRMLNSVHVSIRNSCARPLRRAVSSIGSYKEPPLNTKMRRAAA